MKHKRSVFFKINFFFKQTINHVSKNEFFKSYFRICSVSQMPQSKNKIKQLGPNAHNLEKAVQAVLIETFSLGETCETHNVK